MKLSLALGKPRTLDRQTAWGCLTSNLAAPGSGTLFAGRRAGYAQLALAAIGLALTLIGGLGTLRWFAREYPRWQQASTDTTEKLQELWLNFRWPLLGMMLFLAGFLWALFSSVQIVLASTKQPSPAEFGILPPRL